MLSRSPRAKFQRAVPPFLSLELPMTNTRSIFLPLAIAATAVGTVMRTAPTTDRGTFITTLGRDTAVLESFTRTPSKLDGDIVVRFPGTVLLHYSVDLAPDGTPTHSVVDVTPLGTNQVLARRVTLDFAHDSMAVDFDSSGHHTKTQVALSGAPVLQLMTGFGASYGLYASPALYEADAAISRIPSGDTLRLTTVDIAIGRTSKRFFVRRSPTLIDADFFGIGYTRMALDAAGRVMSADAFETTERTQTRRTDFVDLHSLAEKYAADDHAGKGLGAASPELIARGKIGGQLVVVTYSSPRRRNREILGKVVPFDNVWRTGANAATVIYLDKNVELGGTAVPAGTYSLWTLPKPDGSVDLIVNSVHGEWGTDYDKSHDLFHIPMKVSTTSATQEDFTIAVADGNPGTLRMSWDNFVWSVPISLAK